MKANERLVRLFQLRIIATVRGAKGAANNVNACDLESILIDFKGQLAKGAQIQTSSVGDVLQWKLADIEVDTKRGKAIMLVNRSDIDAADLAIENRSSGGLRVAKKDSVEAHAYSAHIAFKLKRGKDGSYAALIEQAGVSSQRVSSLMYRAVRASQNAESKTFLYPHPDSSVDKNGKKKTLKGQYKFEMTGHPSADFLAELNKGQLSDIELISHGKAGSNWDTYNLTSERSRVIRLRPARGKVKNMSLIDSVLDKAKVDKQEELKVKFTDDEGDGRTLTWDVNSKQLINEDRFVQKEYLRNFPNRLDTAYCQIHPEIRDKMFYLLK